VNRPDRPSVVTACALGLVIAFGLLMHGCTHRADGSLALTPGAEQGLLDGELVLCEAALGALDPAAAPVACPGSEALLKVALDRVTALAAAAPGARTGSAAQALSSPATHPLVRTRHGYALFAGRHQIGATPDPVVARLCHSPQVQAALRPLPPSWLPVDGGAL
jgi:hypothetical protein